MRKKELAEESARTKKAREKLKKRLAELEVHFTPQALEQKTIEIHHWIARNAHNRVVLKTKSIALFDENQNTAKLSERIAKIAEQLTKS
jgi:hypothetical protein